MLTRPFTSGNAVAAAQMPPRLVLKEEDIEEAFLKGSGPGGQKIVRHSILRVFPWPFLTKVLKASVEQDLVRRTVEAPSYRHRDQITGDQIALSKQKDCPAATRGEDRSRRKGA